jgi:TonB-linked SusC/RagA family outer membrane protein
MKKYIFLFLIFVNILTATAQIKISGRVSDDKGNSLPGVNVILKGTTVGTVTSIDGDYFISAKENDVVVFSFMGFTTKEEPVKGRSVINVVLNEDYQKLDEVVAIAIGIKQQKKKIGYATQKIADDVIGQSKNLNVGGALSGQISGLTVTNPTGIFQAPEFLLRGKKPLLVLDGIPVETDLFDIPTENIESINVLKGTSASALYGSRGRNGAIMLTSKKATSDELKTTVSTTFMVSAGYAAFPDPQHEYGSGSNGKYEFWDGKDGGISDGDMTWGPKFEPGIKIAQWNSPIRDKVTGETIEWYGHVENTIYDNRSRYERVPIAWKQHNNLKNFLETGIISNTDMSVSMKTDRGQFVMTGKYAYQKGQVPEARVTSGGLNFNGSYKLTEDLTLEGALSYSKVYSPNYPRYGYGPKNHMYTILLWMGDDVDGEALKNNLWVPGKDGYQQANYNYAWYNNPYFAAKELSQVHDRNVVSSQVKLRWDIFDNLSVSGRGAVRMKDLFENMKSPKSYMNYGDSRDGDYKTWNSEQTNFDTDLLITYTAYLSDDFNLTVNAGTSYFYKKYQEEYASTDGLIVPGIYNMGNSKGPVMASNNLQEKAITSVYGTVTLDVLKSWFLTLTGRNDWSSTMPAHNNSYFYPSVALSTTASDYIPMPKFIDYLKLYGSWAQVSSDFDPYQIESAYTDNGTYGINPKVTYPNLIINPNIKPEQSVSTEFGLFTSLFKNRLGLEATYYKVIDKNQISKLPLSKSSGFTERYVNGNEYETKGLEVALSAKIIDKEDFKWSARTNWSFNKKTLTKIYGGQEKFNDLKVGSRADDMWGSQWKKTESGRLIIDKNTGLPTKDSEKGYLGHTEPDARFGFQNVFNYKKFTLNLDFDGVIGGVMNSKTIEKLWWGGRHPESTTHRDAEYAAGKAVYVPKGVNVLDNGNIVENTTAVSWQTWCQNYPYKAYVTEDESKTFANVFDRSYVKLRKVALTYNFGNNNKIVLLNGATITLFANNVAIIKNIPLIDPDFKTGNDNNLQDPSARYIGITTKFTF